MSSSHSADPSGEETARPTRQKMDANLPPMSEIPPFPSHFQGKKVFLKDLFKTGLPYMRQRVLVLGGGLEGERIVTKLLEEPDHCEVIGIFDDRTKRLRHFHHSVPVLGNIDDMVAFCRRDLPDIIIISTVDAGRERLRALIRKIIVLPVNIYLAMDNQRIDGPDGIEQQYPDIILFPVSKVPLAGSHLAVKWLEDKILALVFIIILSPIMAIIALLIKIDSHGTVLFIQDRYGFNNKIIKVFKFRTMHINQADPTGAQRTVRNDPRVTRIGRYLRNFSLDELPQFFNVLLGSMSIVGPRAHATAMQVNNEPYEKVIDCYSARHMVKPGITGLAQVMGCRGEIKTKYMAQKRLDYDLYYIKNWSLWMDLKIIFKSIHIIIFKRENTF
ncbi:sugar transferase [Komagataeibacter sp. FNDCR2]|uniref:sugar transferase n=1 Tax=Komagataeibacter sp. FNDCR2 TaxID=2878682 RepID=UPI001E522A2C|nr:sugar transferase [Komagataeibacter sp. FNDCR2]MCE2576850.1 sugar transferase [Komagataeibacter sp. FNDCR2]